jgi:hypothetical protein
VFFLRKSFQAGASDVLQVFYHAHRVFRPVPLIQVLQPPAGTLRALETKTGLTLLDRFAVFNNASQAGNHFGAVVSPAAGAVLLFSEEGGADAAVHPARGNQLNI